MPRLDQTQSCVETDKPHASDQKYHRAHLILRFRPARLYMRKGSHEGCPYIATRVDGLKATEG